MYIQNGVHPSSSRVYASSNDHSRCLLERTAHGHEVAKCQLNHGDHGPDESHYRQMLGFYCLLGSTMRVRLCLRDSSNHGDWCVQCWRYGASALQNRQLANATSFRTKLYVVDAPMSRGIMIFKSLGTSKSCVKLIRWSDLQF